MKSSYQLQKDAAQDRRVLMTIVSFVYSPLALLLIGAALLAWGIVPAIVTLIALQFILLIAAMFTLSAQTLKNR